MDRNQSSQQPASKQHLLEMGVCKKLPKSKMLFTEVKKRLCKLVAHFLAYLQKRTFSLSQFYKQINSSHVLGYKLCVCVCAARCNGLENRLMTNA
jgi:hypothetical protein